MHELSIARALLALAEQRRPPGAEIRALHLQAGPLQAIDDVALHWAWQAVTANTDFADVRLRLEVLRWKLHCPDCDHTWEADSLDARCPCGSHFNVPVGGDELVLDSFEVDDHLAPDDFEHSPNRGAATSEGGISMKVPVVENVLKLNDEVAAMNRQMLHDAGVYTVDLIGAPGCGKTSLLEATLRHLAGQVRIGVLVGDLATSRDGERLARWTEQAVQINTGRGCHLDANQVRQGIRQLDLASLDLLIIENVGNLICPVGFDLGQNEKVGMFSVSEGDDKAAKHPFLVTSSALLLLNKTDLLQYVNFDLEIFRRDVDALNPDVELQELSVVRNDFAAWTNWLTSRVETGVSAVVE